MPQERSTVTPEILGELTPMVTPFVQHLRAANKTEQTIIAYRCAGDGLARMAPSPGAVVGGIRVR